jgi:hypothetical protein
MKKRPESQHAAAPPTRRLTAAAVSVSYEDVLAEALRIQPRFVPEPMLARTGTGFMRSVGVSEVAAAKKSGRR